MRFLILFGLALALQAEDKPTIEQLQAQIAQALGLQPGAKLPPNVEESLVRLKRIEADLIKINQDAAKLEQQLAKNQRKLTIYQQSAFQCQDAMLDQQIEAQAKQQPKPAKPEGK